MAYTQVDLDALDAEIADVRLVKQQTHGDRSATYRDLDELLTLRSLMAAQIAAAAGTSRTRYVTTDKGV